MELIYSDANHRDIGIIDDYDFDLSFGDKENDFEFSMPLQAHCCDENYFLYVEGTEIGGIIDNIKVDTSRQVVTYKGRTWHGILSKSVLQPNPKYDYLIVSGDANEVIKDLLKRQGLEGIFEASVEPSPIYIEEYQFERYTNAYLGIRKMLAEFGGKLKLTHFKEKVRIEAVPLIDYTQDDEWDASQVDFKIERAFHPCNHLICLGSGDLAKRHVIHLFTDENGGIQPYAKVDEPVKDADYILTEKNKKIHGIHEVCETYDLGNAGTEENYVLLTAQPSKWSTRFSEFYGIDEDGEFRQLEADEVEVERYIKLTTKPTDWAKHYGDYFVKTSYGYDNVSAQVIPATIGYKAIKKEPNDWKKTYRQYYFLWSDGTTSEYRQVRSESYTKYELQTMKPSGWEASYNSYYQVKKSGGYERIPKVAEGKKAPTWKKGKYYTAKTMSKAPSWDKTTAQGIKYYSQYIKTQEKESAPEFVANKYYEYDYSIKVIKPAWASGTYYQKVLDNYADLVRNGIDRLTEKWKADKIEINLSAENEYFIGDILGAKDATTGLEIIRAISQKNISIENGQITIKYKLGG